MTKLTLDFYLQDNVIEIAQQLIGCKLCTHFDGIYTSGYITETEAYNGIQDKASHAFGNKRTERTDTMFKTGGIAYVYLCYGVHSLFNVVTNLEDTPHAVLIRAIYPIEGIHHMLKRTHKTQLTKDFCVGPGKVSKALGIHYSHSKTNLQGEEIWIEQPEFQVDKKSIQIGPRIGVDYAEEDALLPYRFWVTHADFKHYL